VTLVGFSMGGGEVVRYLSQYGSERVTKAVLAAAVPPFLGKTSDNPDGPLDEAAVAGFLGGIHGDRIAFLDEFTTNFVSADGQLKVSEAQRVYARDIAAFASPEGSADCITAFATTDFRGGLAKIDVPTLVIHGDSHAIVPFEANGKRSAEAIRNSELVVIAGGPPKASGSRSSCGLGDQTTWAARGDQGYMR